MLQDGRRPDNSKKALNEFFLPVKRWMCMKVAVKIFLTEWQNFFEFSGSFEL
jgi:hypothetical protein